jgi:hypothetical protein
LNTGQHLGTANRFAQAVVGAGVQRGDDLALARCRQQHDHRQVRQNRAGTGDNVFGAMVAGPVFDDEKIEEIDLRALQERGARSEVLTHVAADKDQPVDHRMADGLPNITPTPKLNRYAESAVPNFYS